MEDTKQLTETAQPEQVAVENTPSNVAESTESNVSTETVEQEGKSSLPASAAKRIASLTRRYKEEREKRELAEKAIQANYAQGQTANIGGNANLADLKKPDRNDYADPYEYAEALVKFNEDRAQAQKLNIERQIQLANMANFQKTLTESHAQRALEFSKQFPDYNDSLKNLDISNDHVVAIQTSPKSAEIAYYLAKNPDEALEFSLMNPIEALIQVGRYTEKFAKNSSVKPSSTKPMTPLSSNTASVQTNSKNSIAALRQKYWNKRS
ncbi:MAG: hypothetical protein EKK56_00800 [Flavobacteriaceae bacterium]|nr:MAG: hypothetical protein EKK56_00800 [Flavobacteriaceae bacterium]